MKLRHALGLILGLTLLFGVGGATIGMGLAMLVPGYYQAVFSRATQQGADPADIGVGLGLVQGGGIGLALSVFLVLLFVWRERRTLQHETLEQLAAQLHELRQAFIALREEVHSHYPGTGRASSSSAFTAEKSP
jgi:hypothetical protein